MLAAGANVHQAIAKRSLHLVAIKEGAEKIRLSLAADAEPRAKNDEVCASLHEAVAAGKVEANDAPSGCPAHDPLPRQC